MKNKILFIGPISPPVSGPGVKNKIMVDWLQANSNYIINSLNTYDFRFFRYRKIFKALKYFLSTKVIFLSVSQNGRFFFIPICYFLRKKIVLFPAGGSFDIEINNLKEWKKKLFLIAAS